MSSEQCAQRWLSGPKSPMMNPETRPAVERTAAACLLLSDRGEAAALIDFVGLVFIEQLCTTATH